MPETKQKPDITLTLSRPEYDKALARVTAVDGVKVTDTLIQYRNIRVGYEYVDGKLNLTVLMHPILVTRNYVVGKMQEWLNVEQEKVKGKRS